MTSTHALLTRVPKEGVPFKAIINKANIVEITPKGTNECWMKYWDGKEVRSCIIAGDVETIYNEVFV